MAHFYGTLQGMRGQATRCGNKSSGITTYAASWQGAVRVHLYYDEKTGIDCASVSLIQWRGQGESHKLYDGPVNHPQQSEAKGRVTRAKTNLADATEFEL